MIEEALAPLVLGRRLRAPREKAARFALARLQQIPDRTRWREPLARSRVLRAMKDPPLNARISLIASWAPGRSSRDDQPTHHVSVEKLVGLSRAQKKVHAEEMNDRLVACERHPRFDASQIAHMALRPEKPPGRGAYG